MISYDGKAFSGYQVQPNGRTVQEAFEQALSKMHKGSSIRVTASGRTDAGVHAQGQVLHFDTNLTIPDENWQRALNALLPEDIFVRYAEEVAADFHARYDVVEKEYRYVILASAQPILFERHYSYHVSKPIDVEAIQAACKLVEGKHDFTSFCATKTGVKGDKTRTIYQAMCWKEADKLIFSFRGSGFLYNMVRILVGTLLDVGYKKNLPSDIVKIIDAKDRGAAGKTAPPQGLFLWNVVYRDRQ